MTSQGSGSQTVACFARKIRLVATLLYAGCVLGCQQLPIGEAVTAGNANDLRADLQHEDQLSHINDVCDSSTGRTPLHLAARRAGKDDEEIVQLLLNAGASVYITDRLAQTPLHLAAQQDNPKIVMLLIQHGSQVSRPDDNGQTP